MAKRKTKRNARSSHARRGFKICNYPIVHLAEHEPPRDVHHRIGLTRAHGQPFLFAIAHDEHTIFASWNIDWRSVFETAMPEDRQVHLRVIADGVVETRVTVEPMSAMHYVTISGLHGSYCVEIGYFQPFDTWHCIATSDQVEMPPQRSAELTDADLATTPFHLSFQKLANLFGVPNDTSLARVVSAFQKRVSSSNKPNEATPSAAQILRKLTLSLPDIAAAERDFQKSDTEPLTHCAFAQCFDSARPVQRVDSTPTPAYKAVLRPLLFLRGGQCFHHQVTCMRMVGNLGDQVQ